MIIGLVLRVTVGYVTMTNLSHQRGSNLDAKIKERWLSDLRSGNFKQARAALKNNEGYCCLGVLASQFADEWIPHPSSMVEIQLPVRKKVPLCGHNHNHSWYDSWLSSDFRAEVGINVKEQQTLANMNDCGKSFAV